MDGNVVGRHGVMAVWLDSETSASDHWACESGCVVNPMHAGARASLNGDAWMGWV